MPASPQSPGTAGSIVLVEEYGALAVAIGSALKKFAPGYTTRTVASLAEAEAAIAEAKPDLLVVDFDPPHRDAVDLFVRLKARTPALPVLVIAAARLSEVAAMRKTPAAFQFVEKPFDLSALGRGVESVLAADRRRTESVGALRDLGVSDVVPLQCLSGATGVLKVDAAEGRSGEIHFIDGQITHAESNDSDGSDALREMVRWRSPRFKQPKRRPRAARTIKGDWIAVLASGLSGATESQADAAADEPEEHAAVKPGGGKKIVVIDDTEMLLVFVEDSLATADPSLEIVTASTGSEGVSRVAAVRPDLVLLDYSLPDFNGDQVCRRLLENAATGTIPVIMMSGHVPEMAASALRFQNIVATIAKPFLSDALIDLVGKALADPAQFSVRPLASPASTAPALPKPQPPSGQRGNGHHAPMPPAPAAQASGFEVKPQPPTAPTASGAGTAILAPPAPPPTPVVQPHRSPAPVIVAKQAAIAPPAGPSRTAAMPQPAIQRAPLVLPAQTKPVVAAPSPLPIATTLAPGIAPAHITAAASNAVVVALALEVVAVQFSPALQMAAIRARPAARTVLVHVDPAALPAVRLPEAGFELGPVNLDARGQIDTLRLLPTTAAIAAVQPRRAFPVGTVSVLPWNDGRALELTPSGAAPMTMQLLASFDLAGVELSPQFGVASLVLKARSGDIRVSLNRDGGETAARFKTAQVLLNGSARIAEILLDTVA